MKLWSLTLAAVVVALPALAQDRDHVRPRLLAARSPAATAPFSGATPGAQPSMLDPRPLGRSVDSAVAPTAADAEAFVAQVEARMTDLTERSNRTWWIAPLALTYQTGF